MSSSCPIEHHITTQQCSDALHRYIDEAKPDLLAKNQMLNLKVDWEPRMDLEKILLHEGQTAGRTLGTLTLSSEYISVMINVRCQWKVRLDAAAGNNAVSSSTNCAISEIDSGNGCENHISWNTHFDNELHFIMRVNASCIPLNAYNNSVERASAATEANDHEENSQKLNRKERSTSRKLRSGMIKRLRADPFIRSLLLDEDKSGAAASDGVLLCEALIQQNSKREHDAKSRSMKCEERVNVNSECIEGIRNAILSHCEDNLDVLEMLLRMPYLPRSDVILNKNEESSSNEKTYQEILQC
jgi:hypothetical protein